VLKNICTRLIPLSLAFLSVAGCDSGSGNVVPTPMVTPPAYPAVQQPVPVPVAVPAPIVAAPPGTPLMPVVDEVVQTPPRAGSRGPAFSGVDKPLPGQKSEGDHLVGSYSCQLDAKGLPLGPFKLPTFGCRIFRKDDGSLNLGSSHGIASLRGTIQNPTSKGFFVVGGYKFPGNRLIVKARMVKRPGAGEVYMGKGRGSLNDDKKTKKQYTLTMTKQ
jgi:hypothetical protein